MTKRTDIHRPSAIIPAEYEHVLSYNSSTTDGGWPIPSFGINCELDGRREIKDEAGEFVRYENGKHADVGRCCVVGLLRVAEVEMIGNASRCTVCGAGFVYGEVWRHVPTDEHIHMGHICASKMQLFADRSEFDNRADRHRRTTLAVAKREAKAQERVDFLAKHVGLAEAFEIDHHIISDISERFQRTAFLSDKQVALVLKISAETTAPKTCDHCGGSHELDGCESRHPVPAERLEITGRVLGAKWQTNDYGEQLKLLILTSSGYKVWGTSPSALGAAYHAAAKASQEAEIEYIKNGGNEPEKVELGDLAGWLRGKSVTLTATVEPSKDDRFFGFYKRPTKATVS